jgi:hypothetical protein
MKGTVPGPRWPAPAANATTDATPAEQEESPVDPTNRITLSLLEEHAQRRARGYDPYNASAPPRPVARNTQTRK